MLRPSPPCRPRPPRDFADFAPPGWDRPAVERPVVCIQGLGFVGAAMAAAVARARDGAGRPFFNVLGVDLDTGRGRAAMDSLNAGRFPFATGDSALGGAVAAAHETGNLVATSDPAAYGLGKVILVDVNLDLDPTAAGPDGTAPRLELDGFRRAIRTVGENMTPGALVIVETTVPPGTCERVAAPELAAAFGARGLGAEDFLLAHSYERVMPGTRYLDSIVNYWRVYAGHSPAAAEACRDFLSRIVNVAAYPLRCLSSTTASETAKVLENSYRAVNIALIEEWGRFAEAVGVDLFEVVEAVRQRPTHSNIRQPGFGVGGYCLPKDPLLALAAARQIFDRGDLDFPFCRMAVEVNRAMPRVSVDALQRLLGGSLEGSRVLLLGVSYRPDVADTRATPAALFVTEAGRRGARVLLHDPMVRDWPELALKVPQALPDPGEIDALVFAVAHEDYRRLELGDWLNGARPAVLDANNVLTPEQAEDLRALGCPMASIGRGGD
ncbi:MAG: nucleotide sugar dehydrogenase [Rhodospirillales bacterium]|nr:nucleotide sugar dehydrogenase [Rhodospirillales bacterium]